VIPFAAAVLALTAALVGVAGGVTDASHASRPSLPYARSY
jgi:hypothetical protein